MSFVWIRTKESSQADTKETQMCDSWYVNRTKNQNLVGQLHSNVGYK